MSYETKYHLKKPLLVYILALCFMAAPVGNIIASMIGFGIYHWYAPGSFERFFANISTVDRCWLSLTFFAGCALLHQRKGSWLLAIIALLVTSVFNFHYALEFSGKLARGRYFFPALFMISNLGVVVILYHFRFPYLDRREAWWGVYPRFRSNIPVTADGLSGPFSGMMTNISRAGAFIEGARGTSLELGKTFSLNFGPLTGLQAEVVHVSEQGAGVEFSPTREQARQIRHYVQDLALTPVGETAPV